MNPLQESSLEGAAATPLTVRLLAHGQELQGSGYQAQQVRGIVKANGEIEYPTILFRFSGKVYADGYRAEAKGRVEREAEFAEPFEGGGPGDELILNLTAGV